MVGSELESPLLGLGKGCVNSLVDHDSLVDVPGRSSTVWFGTVQHSTARSGAQEEELASCLCFCVRRKKNEESYFLCYPAFIF